MAEGVPAPETGADVAATVLDQTAFVEDRELITAFLAVAGLLAVVLKRQRIGLIAHARWLVAAYVAMALGCVFTVAETYFLPQVLNALEHISYLLCTVSLGLFCWRAGCRREVALP
ncbi:MAG: hypothetical protein WD768_05350 [Phycisphaeraceae bacterium]